VTTWVNWNAGAAANAAAGNIDWGACLLLAMPVLLVIWVLGPIAPRPATAGKGAAGIVIIIAGIILLAAAVR
jgi:hypothetical protein